MELVVLQELGWAPKCRPFHLRSSWHFKQIHEKKSWGMKLVFKAIQESSEEWTCSHWHKDNKKSLVIPTKFWNITWENRNYKLRIVSMTCICTKTWLHRRKCLCLANMPRNSCPLYGLPSANSLPTTTSF